MVGNWASVPYVPSSNPVRKTRFLFTRKPVVLEKIRQSFFPDTNPNLFVYYAFPHHYNLLEMNEQLGVRARLQPERFHPGNHLKNLNNTFTNALVVVEEKSESAESQERREYSDLDILDGRDILTDFLHSM